ncbi:MAG: acyltransferase [Eubacteriales bacterium]|nr:acyltransferase [Eubacteriales bacterium]
MKRYPGLDAFRMAAAILVVAIHTSPLASFSEELDFWLTRVLARTAVPFFFLGSGYFLLPRILQNPRMLWKEVRKLGVLYLGAILLYLPLNWYSGQLAAPSIGKALKAFFFDGTFYHLWYFPAAVEGLLLLALLQWLFSKPPRRSLSGSNRHSMYPAQSATPASNLPVKKICLGICLLLYLIGLGGDSYYGLWKHAPAVKGFYDWMFQFFGYTRNGLFFAPLFLCLGWLLRDVPRLRREFCGAGFLLCLGLMSMEAFLLRYFELQRHDSMYICLIPCMAFLFLWLLGSRVRASAACRSLSLTIYLIHPWMIVLVRGAAKALHLEKFLIEQSFLHFLAVALSSCLTAVILWKIQEKWNASGRRLIWRR